MIVASAAMIDRTNQDEVDKYNKLTVAYRAMIDPDEKERHDKDEKSMSSLFDSLFKRDGVPQPIRMRAHDPEPLD